VGLRSNFEACQQLMDRDLLGSRALAVVRDDFEQDQDRMHLDCVFSILSDTCCLMLEDMMGPDSPTRRLVDEYVKDPLSGKYALAREGVEFSEYMRGKGYTIIPISGEDQLKYGCNVLNLGQSTVVSVHEKTARQIARSPHFDGDVFFVEFDAITSMYGAVHCSSQVVKRSAARWDARATPAGPLRGKRRSGLGRTLDRRQGGGSGGSSGDELDEAAGAMHL